LIRTLVSNSMPAGYHNIKWNGNNEVGSKVSAGLYFYRIKAGNFVQTHKMIMIK